MSLIKPGEVEITAIAAVAQNGVIGGNGEIPWYIPEDFKRFKAVTMGGVMIMGRKTYESIGRPLPGRKTIVVSRAATASDFVAPAVESMAQNTEVHWCGDVSSAVELATKIAGTNRIFIIGGGQIYRAGWDYLTELDITEVAQTPDGDATFPEITADWQETWRENHDGYSFVTYRRR